MAIEITQVKNIRPYLYNGVYSNTQIRDEFVSELGCLDVSFKPEFNFFPLTIHMPMKKTFCKNKHIQTIPAIMNDHICNILRGIFDRHYDILINVITDMIAIQNLPYTAEEYYFLIMDNISLLFMVSFIPHNSTTIIHL